MKYIFGNWKMYLDNDESKTLVEELVKEKFDNKKVGVAIFPSALALTSALALSGVTVVVKDSKIEIGAQDVYWTPKGAYTGAVSALMYKNVGCKYALVGHSERRHLFGETDEEVRKKIEACLDAGLVPVVCIGETKEEKDGGKRQYRLKKQLMKAFEGLKINGGNVMVAYEPVWAIGTGDPCNPADADDVHGWIKGELKQYFDKEISVLYGGSVNETNAAEFVARETIDGVLVGGASTKLDSFVALIKSIK